MRFFTFIVNFIEFKFEFDKIVDVPADDDSHGDDNEHENNKTASKH